MKDIHGDLWRIKAYGIEEITSSVGKVDISKIINLFPNVDVKDIRRPAGKIDLLIGLDHCNLLPDKIAEIDKLQLMKGPLGYCLH